MFLSWKFVQFVVLDFGFCDDHRQGGVYINEHSTYLLSVSARMIGVQHPAGLVVCLIILFIFYYAYFFLGACACMQLLWHTCGSQDSVQILEGNLSFYHLSPRDQTDVLVASPLCTKISCQHNLFFFFFKCV